MTTSAASPEDWKLSTNEYNEAIRSLENEGIDTGRGETKKDNADKPGLLYKQCLEEMKELVPDDDEDNRPGQVKNFIKCSNLLKLNDDDAREIIIKICKKFRLTTKWETNITQTYKRLKVDATNENSTSNAEQKDEPGDALSKYPEIIREQAYKILKEGDPLKFILDTWNLRHVGDRNIGENCLCSVASTYIINTRGLHVKPSGESGKGKSDAVETVLILLPEHKYISGSMSSKSLYYHPDLKSGTIIYSDDANFTDDTIATLKQSTSNFQAPCKHRTVVNQEYAEYLIPERCSYWFSTVDAIPDPQLANRFINGDVDGSKEQDKNVYDHIKASELDLNLPIDDDVLICRCIFDILGKELYIIKIPYINAIEWTNIENRRNFPKFLDILRSVTFFSIMQRGKINGYYLSDIQYFTNWIEKSFSFIPISKYFSVKCLKS